MESDTRTAHRAQDNLFDWIDWPPDKYPQSPGFKAGGTSRQAAIAIAPHAATVRAAVLREYVSAYPGALTADRVASLLNESILTVRPRVTELKRDGLLELTSQTLANAISGHQARALRATAKAMEANR